ncbi:MAG: hypothetical protein FWC64_08200 [Treponema sp.]|nr:hypothetical protein [Treponema sp.]
MVQLQDILAAIGVVFNGIPMMIFAMGYGFMAVPTAIGFAIGAGGMLIAGTVTPISIQAGTIALVGTMGRDIKERLSIALFAGLFMAVVGMLGLIHIVRDFAGLRIVAAMQAGVGIILARVAIDMIKSNKFVGLISMVSALAVWLLTRDLVYTIVVSVVASSLAYFVKNRKPIDVMSEKYKFSLYKPMISYNVVRGALALACLTIGSNIAFGNITAGMPGAAAFLAGEPANINALTVYSGLANLSALFGGAPVEAIISATGAAPNPVFSGVLMMVLLGIIMVTGLLPKIARFVPMQSISGFLFVIGAFATIPGNAYAAFSGAAVGAERLGVGLTILVTALTDPFIGLASGTLFMRIAPLFGL